ncbi:DMT family transporter [Halocatena salina]|uniref:DMT family transporter n=1 Tax=Halocatena salina TaxID=2934340 RepID=A0A8U0A6M7_9EURY|nr:DMT family transporter [Halocatena salina]UPM44516.1 DMT family transporter [Halocatena salina]
MSRYQTSGLFVLLAALWGSSFVATRAALPYVPPVLLAALRFDIAGVLMLGYAIISTDQWRPTSRAGWMEVAIGGVLFVAAHHALLFIGQQYVTSAVASVIISLDPVLAAVFSGYLLADERVTWMEAVGIAFGMFGTMLIANPSTRALTDADARGVVFVFLAAAAFALGAVLTKRYRTAIPVQSMQAWMMLVGAVVLHGTSVGLPGESLVSVVWSPVAIAALGYLSVIAAGVGYLIYFTLLDRIGPVQINLIGYVAPIFAAVNGWLLLGEPITMPIVLGFVVITTGFAITKYDQISEEIKSP